MHRAPAWQAPENYYVFSPFPVHSFDHLAMAVKKHFSLAGSNSVISQIFYERAEQRSLLKKKTKHNKTATKPKQQKTKQTTTCCCQHLSYNKLGITGLGPDVTAKTQDDTFHVPPESSYHLAIITLVGEGDREKDRHLLATLLRMYNFEEEMCRTIKREQEEM